MALEALGRLFGRRTRRDESTEPGGATSSTPAAGGSVSVGTAGTGDATPRGSAEGAGAAADPMAAMAAARSAARKKANRTFEPPPVEIPRIDGRDDVEAVRNLVAAERWVEAVDALADANRRRRDPRLEIALVALRHHAAAHRRSSGRDEWPPRYDDPFPDVVGRLPEIPAAELTTDILGGAVQHHGCLIVRGVFGAEQIARSVAAIERTHQHYAGEAPPDAIDEDPAWYHPFPAGSYNESLRQIVAKQGGTWMGDSPAGTAQVLDEFAAAGVTQAITGHLGERPFFSLQKSTLRRSLPVNNMVAWHQDGSFFDPDIRTMNVWVALSPCGGDRPSPGMEVIPRRFDEVLPVDGVMTPHSISYDLIAEYAAEMPTVIPEFDAGDAMIFDERFVHRTHLAEGMTDIRYALECWFFAPSHVVSEYVPLLV